MVEVESDRAGIVDRTTVQRMNDENLGRRSPAQRSRHRLLPMGESDRHLSRMMGGIATGLGVFAENNRLFVEDRRRNHQ